MAGIYQVVRYYAQAIRHGAISGSYTSLFRYPRRGDSSGTMPAAVLQFL